MSGEYVVEPDLVREATRLSVMMHGVATHSRDCQSSSIGRMNVPVSAASPTRVQSPRMAMRQPISRSDLRPLERVFTEIADVNSMGDRKSTRLNSSHVKISYAVFCLN